MMDVQHSGAVRALAHIFPQDAYPFPRTMLQSRWASEIASLEVDVYVIEDDEAQVVGFAAIRGNELLHFGTAVQTWGTGLATAAHGKLIERLAEAGATSVRLRVFEENHRARRFYEKLGWRPSNRVSRTSFPPHPVLIEYELDL
jgi:RimJ/RimL family protein N-acetyltransferase